MDVIFKALELVERLAARGQGKGYLAPLAKEAALLRSMGRPAPTLGIDIGGNIGDYTAELRKISPALEVHTFEPARTNVAKLEERFSNDKLVHIIPAALGDQPGTATLFSDQPGSGLGSLTQRKLAHHNIVFDTSEDVRVMRFEDYWSTQLQGRPIDLVKIDIEGHELSALKGFGGALHSTSAIQFEFGGTDIDTRVFFRDFWFFFSDHGFAIHRITPFGLHRLARYTEASESFVYTNYVAVNERS